MAMPDPPLTASYTGFVNGQNLVTSGVIGPPTLSTTATGPAPLVNIQSRIRWQRWRQQQLRAYARQWHIHRYLCGA